MDPFAIFSFVKDTIAWDDGSFDHWKYRSPTAVILDKKAKCNDASNYLHTLISKSELLLYDIRREDGKPITVRVDEKVQDYWVHNNLLFQYNNKYWIAEWMWCNCIRSILGPYNSKDEAVNAFIAIAVPLINAKLDARFVVKNVAFRNPPYGVDLDTYQELATSGEYPYIADSSSNISGKHQYIADSSKL